MIRTNLDLSTTTDETFEHPSSCNAEEEVFDSVYKGERMPVAVHHVRDVGWVENIANRSAVGRIQSCSCYRDEGFAMSEGIHYLYKE